MDELSPEMADVRRLAEAAAELSARALADLRRLAEAGSGRPDALRARLTMRLREDDMDWLESIGDPGAVIRELIRAQRREEETGVCHRWHSKKGGS